MACSRSMRDREAYTRQCKVLKGLLSSSRTNYYSNLVAENQSNMRWLFVVFSKLLHRRHEAEYPKHDSKKIEFASKKDPRLSLRNMLITG